ncbi:hypothetical protein FPV67DRAFT_237902 [Lyophyllum atratum]|nr:hypothetical protein FPV67DRAFT_237902 [Lyophyllum atratum]
MFDHSQIPAEVFAAVFEIGVLTWDIQFLPPLRLVRRTWDDIITTTPRLWGIVTIHKEINIERVKSQITRAKSSPLSVFVKTRTRKQHEMLLRMLVELSSNWIRAEVSVSLLARCRWSDLRGTLETLRLTADGTGNAMPKTFFDVEPNVSLGPPRLRSLTAVGLSEKSILPFLSASITYFELCLHEDSIFTQPLSDTLTYLTSVPHVLAIKLEGVRHIVDRDLPTDFQRPVHLTKLVTLELDHVLYPSALLCEISTPSLQTFILRHSTMLSERPYTRLRRPELEPLSPIFTQWSHGIFLPVNLHTLVLEDCLQVQDVAFLIRWLERLPRLVRLTLWDDAISEAAELPSSEEETNIFRALTRTSLCPSLMQLRIAADLQVTDLVPIARARGGRYAESISAGLTTNRLRYLEAPLCPSGSSQEIEWLKELVDEVRCACLSCQFDISL